MRFVELKSEAQLDAQILHRARSRLVGHRTALINQLRAVLLERGIVLAKGRRQLEQRLAEMLDEAEPPGALSARTLLLIKDMRVEWRELDRRIAALSAEFVARARDDQAARRLATIRGFGAFNATGLVAAIGTGETFRRARDLAAWLGLVPRQATTGGKPRLLGITKRGNLPARASNPRRACSPAVPGGQRDATRRVAARAARESAQEHRCRSACRQVGADRLGRAAVGRYICRQSGVPARDGLIEIDRRQRPGSDGQDVCGRWTRDGLTVDRAPWNLGSKNGARRRGFYEGQGARNSILAEVRTSRPDTLAQTGQIIRRSRLPTGRAIRF
jgi:hypothetical protein